VIHATAFMARIAVAAGHARTRETLSLGSFDIDRGAPLYAPCAYSLLDA